MNQNTNIVIGFEYTLCPASQGYLKGTKPYEPLIKWLNKMHEKGYKIWITSEQFYDIRSEETMNRVKWLHDNNIEYDMLVTKTNLPFDYYYFVRRFEYNDLFIIDRKSNVSRRFTGVDFNLPQ